ncbi:MAG: FadR/GntR family transcriptional regulator [Sphingomonadales bacterium]
MQGQIKTEGARPARKRADADSGRRPLKISETIAHEILRDIVDQGLTSGDRLPREADMLVQYGISRSSLREALRLLEVQGLIRIRPGPGGGPVVGDADDRGLSRTLRLYLHMMGTPYEELLQAWRVTDPLLAELAALNPDRERVKQTMAPYVNPVPGGDVAREGTDFHVAVADLAGNEVLSLMFRAMTATMEPAIVSAVRMQNFDDEIVHDHGDIARAIVEGKAARAHKLMKEHVEHIIGHFEEFLPHTIGGKVALG